MPLAASVADALPMLLIGICLAGLALVFLVWVVAADRIGLAGPAPESEAHAEPQRPWRPRQREQVQEQR
jgi:hypothetical protein